MGKETSKSHERRLYELRNLNFVFQYQITIEKIPGGPIII